MKVHALSNVRGDNNASGLSCVQVDKHGITVITRKTRPDITEKLLTGT